MNQGNVDPNLVVLCIIGLAALLIAIWAVKTAKANSPYTWDTTVEPTGYHELPDDFWAPKNANGDIIVRPGQRVLSPASAAKLETLHHLLGLLDEDDMNFAFVGVVSMMSELGFQFKGEPADLLIEIERWANNPVRTPAPAVI